MKIFDTPTHSPHEASGWELFGEYVAPPNVIQVVSSMNEAEKYLLSTYAELDFALMLHDGVRDIGGDAIVEGMMYLIMKYLYAEDARPIPVLVDTYGGDADWEEPLGEYEEQWRLDTEAPDEPDNKVIERYADIRSLRPDYRDATGLDFNHPREAYEPWVRGFVLPLE